MAYLIKKGLMTGDSMTVTGKTLGENVDQWMTKYEKLWEGQDVIRPVENPIKETGHIRYVNL
jgi:dihydroxy-acid dehydratase